LIVGGGKAAAAAAQAADAAAGVAGLVNDDQLSFFALISGFSILFFNL
jgi:hypothetical protein